MLLPAAQYGDWPDVKKRMRRIATRIKSGESVVGVMSEDGMRDTDATPGMLIIGGAMHRGWTNFHCFMPWKPLMDALHDIRVEPSDALEARIFDESISVPWGVLGLLASENTPWFYGHAAWYEPFLRAVLEVWDSVEAVGARYYTAVEATNLWSIPNSLHYVLANMGVPGEVLRAPLPAEGPRGLLRYAKSSS